MFGSYVEASTYGDVLNTMILRTHGFLSLGPSGNFQVSLKCFDLKKRKVIMRRIIKVLPTPDKVLKITNLWDKKLRGKKFGNKVDFLHMTKEKYD